MVSEAKGFITSIMLYAPRTDEDKNYRLESDDADWELAYAKWIAASFLPPDATFAQEVELSPIDDWHQIGFSQSLLDTVPPTVFEYVSHDPTYGGFQVWYTTPLDGDGISMFTLQLQIEDIAG